MSQLYAVRAASHRVIARSPVHQSLSVRAGVTSVLSANGHLVFRAFQAK